MVSITVLGSAGNHGHEKCDSSKLSQVQDLEFR